MKIIVVSDSHGFNSRLDEVLNKESDADCFIHCGDIECSEDAYPMYHTVQGNNDLFCDYPQKIILPAMGHRILVMHGNQFPYRQRLERMAEFAKQEHCDIFCYGHSHIAAIEQLDQVLLLNPGSLWRSRDGRGPSYAVLYLEDQDIRAEIKFID